MRELTQDMTIGVLPSVRWGDRSAMAVNSFTTIMVALVLHSFMTAGALDMPPTSESLAIKTASRTYRM